MWQVKSGTIFDNVLITDDEAEAAKGAALFQKISQVGFSLYVPYFQGENDAKAADEKKEAEKKAAEEAEKKASEEDAEEDEGVKDEL